MVETTGINVPSIEEVSVMDGKWYFKSSIIKGTTLFSMIQSDPDNADKYLDKMIEIQTSIHKNRLDKLPFQKEKFADYIINPNEVNIEQRIKDITPYGADGVIEAAGGNNTFEFAWKIARPNATVFVVAMYEQAQVLPLEKMYGKNLTFKTGGVDAIYCDKLLQLISENKISTDFLISKTFAFSDIEKAYEEFQQKHIYKIALKF